jgi:hypothetical protein
MSKLTLTALSETTTFTLPTVTPTVTFGGFPNLNWDHTKAGQFIAVNNSQAGIGIFEGRYNMVFKTVKFDVPNLPGLSAVQLFEPTDENKQLYALIDVRKNSDNSIIDTLYLPFNEFGEPNELDLNFSPNINEQIYLSMNTLAMLYYDPRNVQAIYDGITISGRVTIEAIAVGI